MSSIVVHVGLSSPQNVNFYLGLSFRGCLAHQATLAYLSCHVLSTSITSSVVSAATSCGRNALAPWNPCI